MDISIMVGNQAAASSLTQSRTALGATQRTWIPRFFSRCRKALSSEGFYAQIMSLKDMEEKPWPTWLSNIHWKILNNCEAGAVSLLAVACFILMLTMSSSIMFSRNITALYHVVTRLQDIAKGEGDLTKRAGGI